MSIYKVGIIGCGRIAGDLEDDLLRQHPCTHVGAYKNNPAVEIVACCSQHADNAQRFAEKFSISRYYTDYRTMLREEALDIVSIATYAPSHCTITLEAARHKVKGIFCEKAMATSIREAELMIQACTRHKVVLMVNHTRRWAGDFIHAKEMIERGAIGKLQSLNGTFSGNLIHTGIHMFDAMIFFAGIPHTVWGILKDSEKADRIRSGYTFFQDTNPLEDKDGVITISFKNGVIGQVLGLGKRYFVFELDIQGSEGRIRIGNGLFEYWKMAPSKHYADFRDLALQPYRVPPAPLPFVAAVKDLIVAIEEKRDTRCSGKEALKSLEVALAAHISDAHKGKPVSLPLKNKTMRVVSR
ncbi:MAG: Gfo/Idh/MocA family oxidoreductase [Candidatus Omnitrophica bacterium]|nr:Gfo/Idh/MocA family oxidoreductase [Candidatus Omnitrophota bacterium]